MKYYRFDALLLDDHWIAPAYAGITPDGNLLSISETPPGTPNAIEYVNGIVLPGFQNAHSHAFQYAMAGLAERHAPGKMDDFWSWREAMYRCALRINPDQMEAIAAGLYSEMLRNGYTHVAEFHYLHHDKDGRPYANSAEMGERLLAAASMAGIKITLIPIFYQLGNFGKAPEHRQKRFLSRTIDDYFKLLARSEKAVLNYSEAHLGFGVHSLRAVNHLDIIETFRQGPVTIPFHLHAAEQMKEVNDCIAYLGTRPVKWLLENIPLSNRVHLIHCTHMNDDEVSALARTGTNVVLCPGTEGNLGDGIFRLSEYCQHDGNWSLGTDSNINLNPLEDLRWMDYAQRLTTHKRNTFDDGGITPFRKVYLSGSRAMQSGEATSFFKTGASFDAAVFRSDSPLLSRGEWKDMLSTIIYSADSSNLLGTIVNGKWIVKDQRHLNWPTFERQFRKALKELA